MKKVWLCFLPVFLLGLSYCSINVRGTDLEPQESCAAEPVFLDEDGFIVPLPAESVTWPSGADPTFVDIEGFVDQNAIVSGSRSSDIYISPGDDEQHTLNLYSASSGGLTSQTEMRWEPSSGNFASIAIVEPGAAFPFGFEVLGFANHCNCSNDNEDYSARLVMKPAPDLYDGQEYVLVTIVNNGVVTHQSFSRASYAMVAGWPWWLGGGTAPPAANPPPVGPAVPPPPVGGPAVLPPLPPGAALPPGMGSTVGEQYVRIGLALAKMGSKRAKCAWLTTQLTLWCGLPLKLSCSGLLNWGVNFAWMSLLS